MPKRKLDFSAKGKTKVRKTVRSEPVNQEELSSRPLYNFHKQFHCHKISKKQVAKWKSMNFSTVKFMEYLLKDVGVYVVKEGFTFVKKMDENRVLGHLQDFQNRVKTTLSETVAPQTHVSYLSLDRSLIFAKKQLQALKLKHEYLEKEIKAETETLEELEEKIEET